MSTRTNDRDSNEVFDGARFRTDVTNYLTRHNLSKRELAAAADLDLSSMLRVLRDTSLPMSLRMVVSLANVADLSIDHYRRPYR